jgi:hypothetical protein
VIFVNHPAKDSLPEKLIAAGADAPGAAVALPEGIESDSRGVERFLNSGVIQKTPAGLYYVDRQRWSEERSRFFRIGLLLMAFFFAFGLIVWMYGKP